MDEYIFLLKNSAIFAGVKEDEILTILHCLNAVKASKKKDSYILRAGEHTDSMGMLLSGSALIVQEDIWGLVINEAMAYGLPVITTDRCVAGLELVEEGVNGSIVPVGDDAALAGKMKEILSSDLEKMGTASLEKIRAYTIENMAKAHVAIFEKDGR